MKYKSFAQVKAVENANKERWLKVNGELPDTSGIYILTRQDENGIMYSYVGQAKHILTRLAQHLNGHTQHIDVSLKKHKLYNAETNPFGWKVEFKEIPQEHLDEFERQYITEYLRKGYQSRNKTFGGQDKGKVALCENTAHKGYYDGKKQGYEDCRKYVRDILSKYMVIAPKGGKLPLRKYYEFLEFLGENENGN